MFLNETNVAAYDAAKAEAAFLYEAILEANEAYHDICMKMVKCEHYCIVNENAEMLNEAEEEAKKSVKQVVMNLLKKVKEALVNFKNFMMEQLSKLSNLLGRAVKAAVSGTIRLVDGIKGLKKANRDLDKINAMNTMEDLLDTDFESDAYNEAEEAAGENVDAKQAVNESKNIFGKLKAAVSKLNFFKATAEKAAREGDEHQAHKKLSAVSSAISKGFAKIRNAFKVAANAVWTALKAAAQAMTAGAKKAGNAAKAAASNVKAKMSKTEAPKNESKSILDQF